MTVAIHAPKCCARTSMFVLLLFVTSLVSSAHAQDGTGASDWDRSSLVCAPACRDGYICARGECVPVCSPACPEGYLCSAEGSCVHTEPAPVRARTPLAARWRQPSHTCEPSCRSGYTCVSGSCVSLCNPVCAAGDVCTAQGECIQEQLAEDTSAAERPKLRDSSADSLVSLHVDLAGALQFGITPTLEIGKTVSGFLQLRVVNTGLASYFLLGRDADDKLRLGLGAALGVHWFSAARGNMRGVYGGVALEYAFVETRDTSVDFAQYSTHALIPQLDVGYRWAFDELLLGVALKLGLAVPLANSATGIGAQPCRRTESCVEQLGIALIPGIAVDVGWFVLR